ncbi:MAG: DUF1512 domain-containing protein [Candidatus Lokiarchaeota archaeon]|nr:DUF1512 domain-containing protein [Candidatus Lokiarchaeota archaeon]MBD3341536.1 DUF1512 domain-containing protein [Candidatus Lokiarchaeota archaeon]
MLNLFQFGQTQSDPFGIILNLMFFLLIFVSMFYGQRIQAWKAAKEIESGLEKIKNWNDDSKHILVSRFKEYANKKETEKDLAIKLEDFMTFIAIIPVMLDPYQIIPKIDHIIDVRDYRFKEEVSALAPNADDVVKQTLENLLEASMAVDFIYRLIKHYLILGKKSKSMILLMQISMQMSIIMAMAKAFYYASKAFAEGSPIGDALGPMVVGQFVRDVSNNGEVDAEEISKDTIMQRVEFEEREIFIVRAKGPGGTVGKPGKAIKILVDKHGESISRVITIDAGLKLSGEKTGSIAVGVGAAIGGIGVEKYYIEESITKKLIPVDALICKQSLEDAITTMKRPITKSVPLIVEKIKMAIRKRTEKGTKIIIAGIGNTIGIGI